MAKVTGFLDDFQFGQMADYHPTLVFRPSGPAIGGAGVFAPENVVTAPVGATGYFEVDLQPTDTLRPSVYYAVFIQWGAGHRVELPWRLFVPSAGGILTDLLPVPSNPAATWVGVEPPTNPTPGTWWLNPITGELSEWSN